MKRFLSEESRAWKLLRGLKYLFTIEKHCNRREEKLDDLIRGVDALGVIQREQMSAIREAVQRDQMNAAREVGDRLCAELDTLRVELREQFVTTQTVFYQENKQLYDTLRQLTAQIAALGVETQKQVETMRIAFTQENERLHIANHQLTKRLDALGVETQKQVETIRTAFTQENERLHAGTHQLSEQLQGLRSLVVENLLYTGDLRRLHLIKEEQLHLSSLKAVPYQVVDWFKEYVDGGEILYLPYNLKQLPKALALETKNFKSFDFDDSQLLKILKPLGAFTYIPNGGNLGDMLIGAGTLRFFDRNHLPYTMLHEATEYDTIVMGGGGMWVKYWIQFSTEILDLFAKAKRVVILPSSFYECQALIDILDERFTVFCREKQSYDYLCAAGTKAQILLDHDMALRLDEGIFTAEVVPFARWVKAVRKKLTKKDSVAYFLRTDCEKADYSIDETIVPDVDLSLCGGGNWYMPKEYIMFSALLMLCLVDMVPTLVTDRLHVCIAGALMGKQVRFLDNAYRKLSTVYEYSLRSRENVQMITKVTKGLPVEKGMTTDNLERLESALAFAEDLGMVRYLKG